MSLNYKIINYKSKLNKPTGSKEAYIDLLSKTYSIDNINKISGTFVMVNKYYVARPDLISLAFYQDDSYADIICKINGISNPFELGEDTLLFIPNIEMVNNLVKNYNNTTTLITEEEETLGVKKLSYQKEVFDKRSPNEQLVGQQNYVIDRTTGLVFY